MSENDIKRTLEGSSVDNLDSVDQVSHAEEALRIAAQSALQHLQESQTYHPELEQQHLHSPVEGIELTEYDLKSKDSKYRRWSPKMDQYLIKLLSDVVHSYPKGAPVEMTKKAWAYVTGQLRAANPETVYSTYTKYSCQQHLINVNHHRYKIWYLLTVHLRNVPPNAEYSYRWDADSGRFQIVDNTNNTLVLDERQIKSLLYGDALSLPVLTNFNKGTLIVNDFFLTDNLKYMSVYHNEVLPLLVRLDSRFEEGLGDVYTEIPKFEFRESRNEYFKPLIPTKPNKIHSSLQHEKIRKRLYLNSNTSIGLTSGGTDNGSDISTHEDDSVDPALKRSRNSLQESTEFENVLATAAIAAINSPTVTNGRSSIPFYVKDRKWFNKLISLNEVGLLDVSEVLTICEGVRDGKIPLFMLNILDPDFYDNKDSVVLNSHSPTDEDTVKKIRQYMLPIA